VEKKIMKKGKVMFINAPQSTDSKQKFTNLKFPLGFLYMGDILEKNGFGVKILDSPLYWKKRRKVGDNIVRIGLYPDEIKKEIKNYDPDIIGISCAYTAYESDAFEAIDIAYKTAKEMGKKILIVIGGAHTSANPDHVLRNEQVDIAVTGEGEETILEIAQKYMGGERLDKIQGTTMKIKGKIVKNPLRDYIVEVDKLRPAWHLVNMKQYFNHPDNHRATLRKPSVDVITSRGCPANCVFCSIYTVWGRKWRAESATKVVDEIEFLVNKYGVRQFRFQDDNLTLDNKRMIAICDEILRRKIDIRWDTPNGIAFWALNKEVLFKMRQAGCYRVTFGIESGSKESLRYIRKVVDLGKVTEMVKFCHSIGIWVCSTFIIGFPNETIKEIKETEDFVVSSGVNFPFVYIAQPYMGTDLYNDFERSELLANLKKTSNISESKYDTMKFSNDQLNQLRANIIKRFYKAKLRSFLNPKKFHKEILSKIRSFDDIQYVYRNLQTVTFRGS
jgi:anaerobic magnesium-protoporphyrin IX monomethyl ester cyclase